MSDDAARVNWVNVLCRGQDPNDPDTPQWVAGTLECLNCKEGRT